ncbi:MAG: hypothetical protein P8R54_01250 [Myxococcota bacterium]|nr:hypothetical protein [Myxococcota bacterium]
MLRLLLPGTIALLSACTEGKDSQVSVDGDLKTVRSAVESGSDGLAVVLVEVESGEEAMMVTASSSEQVAVEEIVAPDGSSAMYWEDWYGAYSLTSAIYVEGNDTVVNWPVRSTDGGLDAGTWEVHIGVVDGSGYYVSNEALDVVTQTRTDSDLSSGTLSIEIIYAEGVGSNSDVVAATEQAVARWEDIWAAAGLTASISWYDSDLDPTLTDLSEGGSAVISDLSAAGTDSDLMVLIGESIGSYNDVYGISGGIPGPLTESERAAVVISWPTNAGGDGAFSDEDIRLYGETLAHEVGHYTGLFHPVEDGWEYWDALDDTSDCASTADCEAALGDNLMFPYPVCDWDECVHQDDLSGGQQGVMHRYAGTL